MYGTNVTETQGCPHFEQASLPEADAEPDKPFLRDAGPWKVLSASLTPSLPALFFLNGCTEMICKLGMFGCRRTRLSQEPAWADLPKHIVVLFMRKTLTNGKADSKTFRALQSVCKAWREAFTDFSADIDTATIALQNADDLFEVCKMLPGLASLRARKAAEFHSLFLHPLSACSRLTNLSLSNYGAYAGVPTLDLILLPAALKDLRHRGIGHRYTMLRSYQVHWAHKSHVCPNANTGGE